MAQTRHRTEKPAAPAVAASQVTKAQKADLPAAATKSVHEHLLETVGYFLYQENFPPCIFSPPGLLALLDSVPGYVEEGARLYPEIIFTTDLVALIAPIKPVRVVPVGTAVLSAEAFQRALKKLAPLARDGWVIYIQRGAREISYGLVSAESSEMSPSLHRHLVGNLRLEKPSVPMAYIRSLGSKVIQLTGYARVVNVSLSLNQGANPSDEILRLCQCITRDVSLAKDTAEAFLLRLLETAIQESHGSLIAVAKNSIKSIAKIKQFTSDGVYLPSEISFSELLKASESEHSREASTQVRSFGTLVRGMVNHDGVTLFSTGATVLGYNIFVPSEGGAKSSLGGARSRAFESIRKSDLFCAGLFKSQDGMLRYFEKK